MSPTAALAHQTPTGPVVRACTTAAEVRSQAVEPAQEIAALCRALHPHIVRLYAAAGDDAKAKASARELVTLVKLIAANANVIAGFTDLAHARLAHAEASRDFDRTPEDSEATDGRTLSTRIKPLIDAMAGRDREAVEDARARLHAMFVAHGRDVLFRSAVTDRLRAQRTLALEGVWREWKAGQP